MKVMQRQTQTGGRPATTGHIPGEYSLAVGMPPNRHPQGWKWTLLTEVARLESGHTPSRKHPEYWGGDIPWIGIRDATENHGRTLHDTEQHTNELGINNSSARVLPENTVCLSRTASVGYVVVMGRPMATSQDFVNWVCSKNIDHQFLKYVLLSERRSFLQFASGTTHQTIYFPEVKAFHVCLPPLSTQRKIAGILSAYDDLIENNTRRIAILEEMAQAIYREWFVHFRFPGHETAKFVDSPLGKVPEGWEILSLSSVCARVTDGAHRSPKSVDSGLPMASMKDMEVWGLNIETCRLISQGDFEELVRTGYKPQVGDVLVAKDGASYLKYAFVIDKELEVVLLSSIAVLRPNGRLLPHLMAFMLRDPAIKGRLANHVTGAAIPRIIVKDFARFTVAVPPKDVQAAWWNHVSPMVSLIHVMRAKIANLRPTRDLLLPKLISGQLDVEGLEIETGDGVEGGEA